MKDGKRAHVRIAESKTNYYVSFRPVGWDEWIGPIKVRKSTLVCNMLAGVSCAYIDYMKENKYGWE